MKTSFLFSVPLFLLLPIAAYARITHPEQITQHHWSDSTKIAQLRPPDQMIQRHWSQAEERVFKLLPAAVATGEIGTVFMAEGLKIIRIEQSKAMATDPKTGLIISYNADPNQDGADQDARYFLIQPYEFECPSDIEERKANPRFVRDNRYEYKPYLDVIASMVIQDGKKTIDVHTNVLEFEAGSNIDKLYCQR